MHRFAMLFIGILLLVVIGRAYAPDTKGEPEQHPRYQELKNEADLGYWGACYDLAKLYEGYGKDAEAFEYWQCAMRDGLPANTRYAAKHLAGHYFHGIGVEANPEMAAMYLILSNGHDWSHEKNRFRSMFNSYHDIIDIPDIEDKFLAGAKLVKQNDHLHSLEDKFIRRRLNTRLKAIQKAKDGNWMNLTVITVMILLVLRLLLKRFIFKD